MYTSTKIQIVDIVKLTIKALEIEKIRKKTYNMTLFEVAVLLFNVLIWLAVGNYWMVGFWVFVSIGFSANHQAYCERIIREYRK